MSEEIKHQCTTHGDIDWHHWGCPECVRELRQENERLERGIQRLICLARVFARAYQTNFVKFHDEMLTLIDYRNPERVDVDEKIFSAADVMYKFSSFQGTAVRHAIEKFAGGDDTQLEMFLGMQSLETEKALTEDE